MQRRKLGLVALAVIGMFAACGDDPTITNLGVFEGPSAAQVFADASGACTENCDGVIDEVGASAGLKVAPDEGTYDDDYEALVAVLLQLMQRSAGEAVSKYLTNASTALTNAGVVGATLDSPPAVASADLDAGCAPGSGRLSIAIDGKTTWLDSSANAKTAALVFLTTYQHQLLDMQISDCEIAGNITGMGDEVVTLDGRLALQTVSVDIAGGDARLVTRTLKGSILVNPSDTGGSSAIWGDMSVLTFNLKVVDEVATDLSGSTNVSATGGACYGGVDAVSPEACDGVFMDGKWVLDVPILVYIPAAVDAWSAGIVRITTGEQ